MKSLSKILITISLFIGFLSANAQSTWVAPKSADAITNPLKNDLTAIKKGKTIYQQLCAVCHGDKGKGDGLASASLNPKPANFLSEKFQKQTDGAVFWKLTEGKAPMASYKESLSVSQRWQLVSYLKSLK
ncbi:cytochrome c [Lutibacter sp. HS1-25]|uniref:c-type cytochrome n=1 Tax=Lutibacter sp. HS1-25 TaxID=2485000 RepID=UPI0010135931|nr:cytochrome c [Lutibacter sp. HS1-25]RXP54801.1 cytochrome c [Lutibacter sp. HS1-25]